MRMSDVDHFSRVTAEGSSIVISSVFTVCVCVCTPNFFFFTLYGIALETSFVLGIRVSFHFWSDFSIAFGPQDKLHNRIQTIRMQNTLDVCARDATTLKRTTENGPNNQKYQPKWNIPKNENESFRKVTKYFEIDCDNSTNIVDATATFQTRPFFSLHSISVVRSSAILPLFLSSCTAFSVNKTPEWRKTMQNRSKGIGNTKRTFQMRN